MKRGERAGEYADGRGRPECGEPVHDAAAPEGSLETAVRARDPRGLARQLEADAGGTGSADLGRTHRFARLS